jgi:hypothetical protein
MTFVTNNAEAMRIDSAGNMGIGAVPAATAKANITSTSAGASTIALSLQNASNTINSETILDFVTNVAGAGVRSAQISAINTNGGTGVNMLFKIGNGAVPTEAMRLDSLGNLLVGITSANANGGVLQLKSGITFPATAVAATDANTLDDYEEGTWVPNQGGGLTVVGAFSSVGRYTKIGNMVTVWGQVTGATSIAVSAIGFITTNLPFALQTDVGAMGIAAGFWTSMNSAIHISIGATTSVYAVQAVSGSTSIAFTISYRF